jgi:mannose-6-phosphate isomerase-like protein (cupin superfamily)
LNILVPSFRMQRRTFFLIPLLGIPISVFSRHKLFQIIHVHKPFKVKSGEARFGKRYTMKGVTLNTLDIKISGKDTDGGLAVFEQTGQTPYSGPPLHVHLDQDEWFHVLEGAYFFRCGDGEFYVGAGETIFLPRNIPHAFVQVTENARTLVAYMPAGKMEAFFAVTDQWASPPTRDEIMEVFAAHGMRVVGDPIRFHDPTSH